jgi:tetratricopeptide (TPR) repeat protein
MERPGALRRLAMFHSRFGSESDGYRVLLKALESGPGDPEALYQAALLARRLGRQREARALCRRLITLEPDHSAAHLLRSTLEPAKAGAHRLDSLGFLLRAHPEGSPQRGVLCQALGRELEDLDQFEAAFVSYEEAARLRASRTGRLLDATAVTAVEKAFAPLCRASATFSPGSESGKPAAETAPHDLFLVGLPCTGFDEFRRWLAVQNGLQSAGPADPVNWLINRGGNAGPADLQSIDEQAVRDFAESLGRHRSTAGRINARWALHDSPGHFQYLGLLRRALPGARFIHLRRDPLDQCLDLFSPGPGEPQLPASSLDGLVDHFTACHRLMGFWRRHFPGALLDVDYESFVRSPEQVWTGISQFLELETAGPPVTLAPFTERPAERCGRARRFSEPLSIAARRLRGNGVPLG